MERIQAAIAKAREERQSLTPAPGRAAPAPRVDPETLWAALPEFLPKPALLERNRVMAYHSSPGATAFDITRTRALRIMQEKGWRRMAVTSPTPACGKSTISVNLALSLARQKDVRAILIEADMRRPAITSLLGQRTRRSVDELLTGGADFADCAVRIGTNLALVTQNQPSHEASDILLAQKVGAVLADIEARYAPDIMIFDTPPLLINDDTLAFLAHLDCALLVAAAGRTRVNEIDRCERELSAQTHVLGVVLNKCRFASKEYGGYSGYDYYTED